MRFALTVARAALHTDLATRRVVGHGDVYAVGDAADFPVKQAFLALLQADAAAEQTRLRTAIGQGAMAPPCAGASPLDCRPASL